MIEKFDGLKAVYDIYENKDKILILFHRDLIDSIYELKKLITEKFNPVYIHTEIFESCVIIRMAARKEGPSEIRIIYKEGTDTADDTKILIKGYNYQYIGPFSVGPDLYRPYRADGSMIADKYGNLYFIENNLISND